MAFRYNSERPAHPGGIDEHEIFAPSRLVPVGLPSMTRYFDWFLEQLARPRVRCKLICLVAFAFDVYAFVFYAHGAPLVRTAVACT